VTGGWLATPLDGWVLAGPAHADPGEEDGGWTGGEEVEEEEEDAHDHGDGQECAEHNPRHVPVGEGVHRGCRGAQGHGVYLVQHINSGIRINRK
jgi:hypothetical protein